jgi:hypothetical protein
MAVFLDLDVPWQRAVQVQTIDVADQPPETRALRYPRGKGDPVIEAFRRGVGAMPVSAGDSRDLMFHGRLSGWAGEIASRPTRRQTILRQQFVQRAFNRLAAAWKQRSQLTSSVTKMTADPTYRAIINLGPAAVPLLLREIEREPNFWFTALKEITGADPVPVEARGRVREMSAAWLQWGRDNGVRW